MTTYLLDIKRETRKYPHDNINVIYHFQIDINGNVSIKKGNPGYGYRECDCITINDNIPIPSYLIKIIEGLTNGITLNQEQGYKTALLNPTIWGTPKLTVESPFSVFLYEKHFELVADTIIRIKTSLKEITENPKEHLDLEQQLNSYIAKSKLQQEYILEVEKKMENLQTAYFDVLNDNKKIKEINTDLRSKIAELEIKLNKEIGKTNNMKQLDEYNKLEQKRLEELEKEHVWYEYKERKKNFNPLNN
jgi:hypothetical protein